VQELIYDSYFLEHRHRHGTSVQQLRKKTRARTAFPSTTARRQCAGPDELDGRRKELINNVPAPHALLQFPFYTQVPFRIRGTYCQVTLSFVRLRGMGRPSASKLSA